MDKIKLGFVPTRRSIFSAPDAIKYRGLTADRLREIGVDIVDIDDINDEGLLFDDSHIEPIVKKFRAEGVDGIMLCHANFGTEYVCARLARELGLPVLLWGPRDERPEPDGTARSSATVSQPRWYRSSVRPQTRPTVRTPACLLSRRSMTPASSASRRFLRQSSPSAPSLRR